MSTTILTTTAWNKEKEQRSKLHKLRQKLSGGAEPFTVDEEEFPLERLTDGDLKC